MKRNKLFAKIAEIFFASGIPVTGYVCYTNNKEEFFHGLPLLLGVIITAGWHIKTINDETADRRKYFKLNLEIIISFFLLVVLLCFEQKLILPIVLITLNWDIYSFYGKNFFPMSMLGNFLGGMLHFSLGGVAAGNSLWKIILTKEAIFFGFAMLSGSMHHDSYDAEDDSEKGYETGAFIYSANFWWQLAVFPMIIAVLFLSGDDLFFNKCFLYGAVIPYFIAYLLIFIITKNKSKIVAFRYFCRAIFGLSAIVYILGKIF